MSKFSNPRNSPADFARLYAKAIDATDGHPYAAFTWLSSYWKLRSPEAKAAARRLFDSWSQHHLEQLETCEPQSDLAHFHGMSAGPRTLAAR